MIASTVIQFEFNVKNGEVAESVATPRRQTYRSTTKAKKGAQNAADDFIEPEPLDLDRTRGKSRAKAKDSEFQVPEDP